MQILPPLNVIIVRMVGIEPVCGSVSALPLPQRAAMGFGLDRGSEILVQNPLVQIERVERGNLIGRDNQVNMRVQVVVPSLVVEAGQLFCHRGKVTTRLDPVNLGAIV